MTTTSPDSGFTAAAVADHFPAGTVEPDYLLTEALDTDPASVFAGISDEDRGYWDRARPFVQDEVLPAIDGYWERADYPLHLVRRLGELDLLRDGVQVEGFAPMSRMAAGLVNMEISRGDGSVATMIAVQGGLALRSIAECGSAEQKQRWLPAIAAGEEYAAFALTEPTHGSDAVALESTATSTAGGFLLNGEKKWIGNGSVGGVRWCGPGAGTARFTATWCRRTPPATQPPPSKANWPCAPSGRPTSGWRMSLSPHGNALPGARSFKDTARVLLATRLGVAWSAVGHATACYETAVQYAKQRHAVRPAAGRLPDRPGTAGPDAQRAGHHATDGGSDDPSRRGRAAHPRTGIPGQIHLHPHAPAASPPMPATCSAATASCWQTASPGTWPTSRRSTPTKARRRCRP